MINKQILLDRLKAGQGTFNLTLEEHSPIEGYVLKNRPSLTYLELHYPDGKIMMDSPDYITTYSKELLDVEYNSILIAGLGLGVQAYVSQDFAQVDVLEIDQNIIDINNQLGYLNENVTIIKDDVFTFSTEKTYDVIVLDIWWKAPSEDIINTLTDKYLPHINPGGFLYIPLSELKIEKKQD